MIAALKKFLGLGPKTDFAQLLKAGAIIVDVRSKGEYEAGHIPLSLHMPLNTLSANINKLDKSKTVITCCASGVRSASAKHILKANGFKAVYNGGGWSSLKNKIK